MKTIFFIILMCITRSQAYALTVFNPADIIHAEEINNNFSELGGLLNQRGIAVDFHTFIKGESITVDIFNVEITKLGELEKIIMGQLTFAQDAGKISSSNINQIFTSAQSQINLIPMPSRVIYAANDTLNGMELWISDGSSLNTHLLKDLYPGETPGFCVSYPNEWPCNDPTYFEGAPEGEEESWYAPSIHNSYPHGFIKNSQGIFFIASDGAHGKELWFTDGTSDGTHIVKDISPGTQNTDFDASSSNYYYSPMIIYNDKLYFVAGRNLWVSDSTESGTYLVKDMNPTGQDYIWQFHECDNKLYFPATNGDMNNYPDVELYVSDGTGVGTSKVIDFKDDDWGSSPRNMECIRETGQLVFNGNIDSELNGVMGWLTDGTAAGTIEYDNYQFIDRYGSGEIGNSVYFHYSDWYGFYTEGLYITDGTTTTLFHGGDIEYTFYAGGRMYFMESNELYSSDGTVSGTVKVSNNFTESFSNFIYESRPPMFAGSGDKVYMRAGTDRDLWVSDGTMSGTFMVKKINSEGSSTVHNVFSVDDGNVLFNAKDSDTAEYSLYVSDGTLGGTLKLNKPPVYHKYGSRMSAILP